MRATRVVCVFLCAFQPVYVSRVVVVVSPSVRVCCCHVSLAGCKGESVLCLVFGSLRL